MSVVILDLEWNGAYSKRCRRFINEIIEFGAVKLDDDMNITDSFSELIKPQIGKKLSSHVEELTHISIEELKRTNNTFSHVLSDFARFLGDSLLMTWGKSDVLTLVENYKYYYNRDELFFIKSYCDLQLYCEKMLGVYDKSKQLGLSPCAEILGIEQDGLDLHRACTDAKLSAECFKRLYNREELLKYITAVDEEFFKRLTFKPSFITDINDSAVDKSQFFFNCDICGCKAVRKTKWENRNKSFRAFFECPNCKKRFMGRISVKQMFDDVVISKKIVELNKDKEKGKSSETEAE